MNLPEKIFSVTVIQNKKYIVLYNYNYNRSDYDYFTLINYSKENEQLLQKHFKFYNNFVAKETLILIKFLHPNLFE